MSFDVHVIVFELLNHCINFELFFKILIQDAMSSSTRRAVLLDLYLDNFHLL